MKEEKQSKNLSPALSNTVIDALGGTAETGRICRCSMAAVSQWRTSGIPASRVLYLRERFKNLPVMKIEEVRAF